MSVTPNPYPILIAFIVGAVIASSATYDYISAKYKKEIADEKAATVSANFNATKRLLEQERVNASTVASLNEKASNLQAKVVFLSSELGKYVDASRRLPVKPNSVCVTENTGVASGAANSAEASSSEQVFLSGDFEAFLERVNQEIQRLQTIEQIAHEYALEIEKQRERMKKE